MEVRQSLADLGMDINQEEAKKILQRYSWSNNNIFWFAVWRHTQCVYMGQLDRIKPSTDFATRSDRVNYPNVHGL
jgi:hypothetical protein